MSAVGRRYARAAVSAAEEQGGSSAVDQMAGNLTAFRDAYRASEALREILHNPVFKDERDKVLDVVLDKLSIGAQARNLIRLLTERDRIQAIGDVAGEVEAIADERAGRVRAFVTSPTELSSAQSQRIARALEKRLGQTVVVNAAIDTQLLGGLVCRVGDLTLDSSVRRQLEVLREQLERRAT